MENVRTPYAQRPLYDLNDLGGVTFDAALLIAIMPHGRSQVVRASVPEAEMTRRYNREGHADDLATWEAVRTQKPVLAAQSLQDGGHYSVIPAGCPVFSGYPAVLHVYREENASPLTDAEIASLRGIFVETEPQRMRLFVLDARLRPLLNAPAWDALSSGIRDAIVEHVRSGLAELSGKRPLISERKAHVGRGAQRAAVQYVIADDSAAHPGEPGAVVCIQPSVDEWAALSPAVVQSHGELARFLPAVQFMRNTKTATLNEVAESVGLSPFHFHRRFVDLTGMAPKQYLFDCQIADAQSMLMEGQLQLYSIARKCGFAHQSHFTSRFRQATGMTPSRWRRAMQDAAAAE